MYGAYGDNYTNGYDPYNNNANYIRDRLNQNNQFNNQFNQSQRPQIICKQVGSIDEAKAFMMENPLNLYIFTDVANGKIYTKQMGNNGLSVLEMYEKVAIPEPPNPQTLEDKILSRLDALEKKLDKKED